MNIQEIKTFPTLYVDRHGNSCHESLLRGFQILEGVKEMLKRGDSNQTILETIEYLQSSNSCGSTK